jgi:hypothetical protein
VENDNVKSTRQNQNPGESAEGSIDEKEKEVPEIPLCYNQPVRKDCDQSCDQTQWASILVSAKPKSMARR